MIFFLCKIRLFGVIIKTPSSGQNCHEVNQSWTLPINLIENVGYSPFVVDVSYKVSNGPKNQTTRLHACLDSTDDTSCLQQFLRLHFSLRYVRHCLVFTVDASAWCPSKFWTCFWTKYNRIRWRDLKNLGFPGFWTFLGFFGFHEIFRFVFNFLCCFIHRFQWIYGFSGNFGNKGFPWFQSISKFHVQNLLGHPVVPTVRMINWLVTQTQEEEDESFT